jgi:hypothetical protein
LGRVSPSFWKPGNNGIWSSPNRLRLAAAKRIDVSSPADVRMT